MKTPQALINTDSFTREEYISVIKENNRELSEGALAYRLREDAANGNIIRIGRNQYVFPGNKQSYGHMYSDEAQKIAAEIENEYSDAEFQIFELTQLNAFVNHLYAHNTIFVFVENDLVDFVFDFLHRIYPGRVMLKPSSDHYYRYLVENQIVILRLPSESPRNDSAPWQVRLEKILVDITVDKLLSGIVAPGELETVFTESANQYYLDINAMFRYARRKGSLEKFRKIYMEYTHVNTERQKC
ncbi:MAG: hypothetical protein MJ142_03350 [Clostridia bacterium]|nr:hypothetical protein [Clostridia bacterium]